MYSIFPIIALSFLLPSHPSQKSGATQLSAKSAVKEPSKEKAGDMIGEAANFHKPGTVHVYFRLQRQTNLRALFFIEKKPAQAGFKPHNLLLSRQLLYQLSHRGSPAGWVQIAQVRQGKVSNTVSPDK